MLVTVAFEEVIISRNQIPIIVLYILRSNKSILVLFGVAHLKCNFLRMSSSLDESRLILVGLEHVKFARTDTTQGGVPASLLGRTKVALKCGKNVGLVYWYCVVGAQMSC